MSRQTPWLYRAEVKGIQGWILASDRLVELKGGSAVVDGLGDAARRLADEVGGELVLNAAGAVEVELAGEDALRRFATAWPLVVAARAPGAELVTGWVSAAGDRAGLHAALGSDRNRVDVDLPEAGPLLARSGRTGLPAARRGGGRDGLEDEALVARLAASREDGPTDALAPAGWRFTELADTLGDRYLAVVHADGNAVGRRVMALQTTTARRRFSVALAEATRAACEDAVAHLARWQEDDDRHDVRTDAGGRRVLRARPVVLGGDDLTFLVDARLALPFVAAYLQAFERETGSRADLGDRHGLTACVGVAFVKTGFPFHLAHELAESLCRAAKEGLADAQGHAASGLLFHRVHTASTSTSWGDLQADGAISGGPYDLPALRRLESLTTALRGLPPGTIREWVRRLRSEPDRAQAHWERMREVCDTDAWRSLAAALTSLRHNPATGRTPEGATALADALVWAGLDPGRHDRLRGTAS